jgi:integrase
MSVRKRTWLKGGEVQEAWIVDYFDQQRNRHIRTFARKKEADQYQASVKVDVGRGVHTAPSKSITIAQAAADWITAVTAEGRERTTIEQYQQHVKLHIVPQIGHIKLAHLTTPRVESFKDHLLTSMSHAMARKVLRSLKTILKDARRRGNVAQNVASDTKIKPVTRGKQRIKAGRDFPLPQEVRAMIEAAQGRRRAVIVVLAFAGLRASELRGLRWQDVNLNRGTIHVEQRADRYGSIGHPKSEAGERTVPVGPIVINTLKEWKLKSSKSSTTDLVFATASGKPDGRNNLVQRVFHPVQIAAKVVTKDGKPKYSGLHSLRHFYASWLINRKQDGGLELPLKTVQARLGHATLAMTADTYSHLFPEIDHATAMAEAEAVIFAT